MKVIKLCQKNVSTKQREAERERERETVAAAADNKMNVYDDIEGSER